MDCADIHHLLLIRILMRKIIEPVNDGTIKIINIGTRSPYLGETCCTLQILHLEMTSFQQ